MSALNFLISGTGIVTSGGELPDPARKRGDDLLRAFASLVRQRARARGLPASSLKVFEAEWALVAEDLGGFSFVLVTRPGPITFIYKDLKAHGFVPLPQLLGQVTREVGDVVYSFFIPNGAEVTVIEEQAAAYVESIAAPAPKVESSGDPPDLAVPLSRFRRDFPAGQQTAFVMMRFTDTRAHLAILEAIRETLAPHGIKALRADDKEYADDLFSSVRTYMHGCAFGIAVFERLDTEDFNPNVSLEVGYMMALGKPVCLLKDGTLKSLQTDLVGRLYKQFNTQDIAKTVPPVLTKWLSEREIITPP